MTDKKQKKGRVIGQWWGIVFVLIASLIVSYLFMSGIYEENLGQTFSDGDEVYYELVVFYSILSFLVLLVAFSLLALVLELLMYISAIVLKFLRSNSVKRK